MAYRRSYDSTETFKTQRELGNYTIHRLFFGSYLCNLIPIMCMRMKTVKPSNVGSTPYFKFTTIIILLHIKLMHIHTYEL